MGEPNLELWVSLWFPEPKAWNRRSPGSNPSPGPSCWCDLGQVPHGSQLGFLITGIKTEPTVQRGAEDWLRQGVCGPSGTVYLAK